MLCALECVVTGRVAASPPRNAGKIAAAKVKSLLSTVSLCSIAPPRGVLTPRASPPPSPPDAQAAAAPAAKKNSAAAGAERQKAKEG